MKWFQRNKKGSLTDLALILTILFFFSFVIVICFIILSNINTGIQASIPIANADIGSYGRTAISDMTSKYPSMFDGAFLFLTIGLCLVTLIFASLVKIHPAFVVLFLIGLIIITFVSGAVSNAYQEMAGNPLVSAYTDQLTYTSTIMEWLPLVIFTFGILLMIIMHKVGGNND